MHTHTHTSARTHTMNLIIGRHKATILRPDGVIIIQSFSTPPRDLNKSARAASAAAANPIWWPAVAFNNNRRSLMSPEGR